MLLFAVAGLLAVAGCASGFGFGPRDEAPPIDWGDIWARAEAVFDVTCPGNTVAAISLKYAARNPYVAVMPEGNRFLVLHAPADDVFIPGTDWRIPGDVRANFAAAPEYDGELGATFHAGALQRARQFRSEIGGALEPGATVRLTGYSLGGATAVILGLYLELDGFRLDSIITFGQFPVTDAAGAVLFADRPLIRVKSGLDGAPDLYSETYNHFGDMVVLLDGPLFAYVRQGSEGFDSATRFHGINPFVDHMTYLDRLRGKPREATEIQLSAVVLPVTRAVESVCP